MVDDSMTCSTREDQAVPVSSPTIETNQQKRNIRYAEKRRTSSCLFADRVAQVSIDLYRRLIPESERPPQTCLSTIVALDSNTDELKVLGLGVGTKFLSEETIRNEELSNEYGKRVRDCHAEVLARRAFRRQLSLEIIQLNQSNSIPEDTVLCWDENLTTKTRKFKLRDGVTLHFYSSSAPCGNATLKKFAKMSKEKFREDLGPAEWPTEPHKPIHGSSIPLGQFALLIKKDNDDDGDDDDTTTAQLPQGKQKVWHAMLSDEWTPPGTTITAMTRKGSIHTCSDKLARWNYLGLQGALLASLLEGPMYPSTFIVGRKFTSCICRRAVCCRFEGGFQRKTAYQQCRSTDGVPFGKEKGDTYSTWRAEIHHPAIMGTGVYMDEMGVVETSSDSRGQDVRFHSNKSWCWWPLLEEEETPGYIEMINGSTGLLYADSSGAEIPSRLSTGSLTRLFSTARKQCAVAPKCNPTIVGEFVVSLEHLQSLKGEISPEYELCKNILLRQHLIFRQWRRRGESLRESHNDSGSDDAAQKNVK